MTPAPRNPPAGALPIDLDEVWQLAATARDLAWGLRECAEQLEGERDPRWVDFTRAVGTAIDRLSGDVCALVNEAEVAVRDAALAAARTGAPGQAGSDRLAELARIALALCDDDDEEQPDRRTLRSKPAKLDAASPPPAPPPPGHLTRSPLAPGVLSRIADVGVLAGHAVSPIPHGLVVPARPGGRKLLGIVTGPELVNSAGSMVTVQTDGVCDAWLGGEVTRGALLTIGADGGLVRAVPPKRGKVVFCIGVAIADGQAGQPVPVLISPSTLQG